LVGRFEFKIHWTTSVPYDYALDQGMRLAIMHAFY
jgi:hypothetical protein